LTTQNNEMMKTLEILNNSIFEKLLSQASKIQYLSTLTTQNKETISTQKNYVNSELSIVKGRISQLRGETYTDISNYNSELRNTLSSVQTKANRADRRIQPLAGKQVVIYLSDRITSRVRLRTNQQASTTTPYYVLPSVSYVLNIIFMQSEGNQIFVK